MNAPVERSVLDWKLDSAGRQQGLASAILRVIGQETSLSQRLDDRQRPKGRKFSLMRKDPDDAIVAVQGKADPNRDSHRSE